MRLLLLFLAIFLTGCSGTKEVFLESNGGYKVNFIEDDIQLESGKCYLMGRVSPKKEDGGKYFENGFYLKYQKPIFKKKTVKLTQEEIENIEKEEESKVRLLVQKAFPELSLRFEQAELYSQLRHPNILMFCVIEYPPLYKTFLVEELKANGYKIERSEMVRTPKIIRKIPNRKSKNQESNQFYFNSGTWTEIREALLPTRCYGPNVEEMKKKLNEFGNYNLEINNSFDEKIKAALIDFQKKNNLPSEGDLTFQTLAKLGLISPTEIFE